jgi:hypothetical protein
MPLRWQPEGSGISSPHPSFSKTTFSPSTHSIDDQQLAVKLPSYTIPYRGFQQIPDTHLISSAAALADCSHKPRTFTILSLIIVVLGKSGHRCTAF